MFARAPFGLKPLTTVFQLGISTLLGPLLFCRPYIDDIISWGDSFDETLENAKALVQVLTQNNYIINRDKCHFLHTRFEVLGFIVSEHGRRVNTKRFLNSRSWTPPTNAKGIRRYRGTFNHFREFIPLFSRLAAPLEKSRKVRGIFILGPLVRNPSATRFGRMERDIFTVQDQHCLWSRHSQHYS